MKLLGRWRPEITFPSGTDGTLLSRDPAVIEAYHSLGLAIDGLLAMDRVLEFEGDLRLPSSSSMGAAIG